MTNKTNHAGSKRTASGIFYNQMILMKTILNISFAKKRVIFDFFNRNTSTDINMSFNRYGFHGNKRRHLCDDFSKLIPM